MTGNEEETAVGYLTGVMKYLEGGGKLTSIDATVSYALLLHGRELGTDGAAPVPESLKAAALREAVDGMRLLHNNLNADAVFRDLEELARQSGSGKG